MGVIDNNNNSNNNSNSDCDQTGQFNKEEAQPLRRQKRTPEERQQFREARRAQRLAKRCESKEELDASSPVTKETGDAAKDAHRNFWKNASPEERRARCQAKREQREAKRAAKTAQQVAVSDDISLSTTEHPTQAVTVSEAAVPATITRGDRKAVCQARKASRLEAKAAWMKMLPEEKRKHHEARRAERQAFKQQRRASPCEKVVEQPAVVIEDDATKTNPHPQRQQRLAAKALKLQSCLVRLQQRENAVRHKLEFLQAKQALIQEKAAEIAQQQQH